MATIKHLLLLAIVATFQWTLAESASKCKGPNNVCVHVTDCPKYSKRFLNKDYQSDPDFRGELRVLRCQPMGKPKNLHICCPKQEIGCKLDGVRGVCLLPNQCLNQSGKSAAPLLKKSTCGKHNGKNYVCCTNPLCLIHKQLCEQSEAPILRRPVLAFPECRSGVKPGTWVPNKLCDSTPSESSEKGCCLNAEPDQMMLHHRAARLARMSCGTTITEDNKIFNGTHASKGEFPWMARLVYRSTAVCSGTLIHPSYVLTARHCAKWNPIAVRLGLRDLSEGASSLQMQQINIEKKLLSDTFDVALLRLSQPAMIEDSLVRPICLPLFADLRMNIPKLLTIAGWGVTETGRPSDMLMKAQSDVLKESSGVKSCTKAHEICIGGENAHSHHCSGDSGGPYQALDVFNGSMRFVQFGVISHGGQFCSSQKEPGRGVLVGYVMDWILDNMIV